MLPRRVTWIKTEREGVKSGRSGVLKTGKLALSRKIDKRSDAGAGDLGVPPIHETLPMNGEKMKKDVSPSTSFDLSSTFCDVANLLMGKHEK